MRKTVSLLSLLGIAGAILSPSSAYATTFTQRMNLHTMLEATTSVLTTLADRDTGAIQQDISWAGTFDDTGWTYSGSGVFSGDPLTLNYVGSLSGQNGQDIVVSFTGTGFIGLEPLTMTGESRWFYDALTGDYLAFEFKHLTKIGQNSLWGWVLGGEIVAGVGAGVVVGAGLATVIGPGGVVPGVAAGTAATGVLVGISAGAQSLLVEDAGPPPEPDPPTPPEEPDEGDAFFEGFIITRTDEDGLLAARDLSVRYGAVGSFSGNSFAGVTWAVPEPSAVALVGAGLAVLALNRRRGRRNFEG